MENKILELLRKHREMSRLDLATKVNPNKLGLVYATLRLLAIQGKVEIIERWNKSVVVRILEETLTEN